MTASLPLYLDYAATTPTDPRVMKEMAPYFTTSFGNAHATNHLYGKHAEEALQRSRGQIAHVLGAEAKEIIFTSGATEANNLALKGAAAFERVHGKNRKHVIVSAIEHRSVLHTAKALEEEGYRVTILPVQEDGLIDPAALKAALEEDTFLVSIMAANNEIGVVQPLAEIGTICREAGVLFHCDAAQAFGKIPLEVDAIQADLLSISGHKIYGPQGIGALYVRRRPRARLLPQMHGGGQERGLRAGTVAVPLAVGLGKAAEVAADEMIEESARLVEMRDAFLSTLKSTFPEIHLNGHPLKRLPGVLNLRMPEALPDEFLPVIFSKLAISTSSACSSARAEPSHVLQALGMDVAFTRIALRISFGRPTSAQEADQAAQILCETLEVFLRSGQDGQNSLEQSA